MAARPQAAGIPPPAKKRGPGRPPKKQPAPPLRKDGVVEVPSDPEHRMEFVYEDPMVFKSLFTYFKNLRARDIHLRCTRQGLTFFTRDNTRTCRIVADLPGGSMNYYYCDDAFWIGLNRDAVEKVFASIDKSFFKITLLYYHDDPDSLSIVFKDPEIEKECHYKVGVSVLDDDEELFAVEPLTFPPALAAYPLELTLSAKQFKKTITDANHYSETITAEKLGTHPFQFTYTRVGVVYYEVYRSPEKIGLRSDVPEGGIFRITMKIANIRSLAAAMVTDAVKIYCREDADVIFKSEIDALELTTICSPT